ncbi:MAG: LysR family transcriptional regulator [Candidatus Korobacteraceae bacterium]
MDLFQLETFLAVVEEKGFSRAAARLHRTQSAVSQTISKLEDELGETLFERSSREGAVTDAGHLLLRYAEELLNLRGRAHAALKELRELQHGKLSIAANEFTALYLLRALHRFRRLHPTIHIEIQRSLASEVARSVVNLHVELGMLSFRPDDDQLSSIIVYVDELAYVVYPGHPLASSRQVSIRDLGAEFFVAHNVRSPYREKVVQTFAKYKTALHMPVELPNIEAIKQFVAMGNGVALLPLIAVQAEINRGELVQIPVKELQMQRRLRLVYRRGASLSHAARAFLKVLESMAAQESGRWLYQKERG